MKGWKKCMVFMLTLGMFLGLAACGTGSSEGESGDYYTPGAIEDSGDDLTDDHPAEQLGYDSIEDMRIQEHEIISTDDSDNMSIPGDSEPPFRRHSTAVPFW